MKYTRDFEVKYNVDVLVLGGGPAGLAAAVTAANQGADTMIIEQTGSFGGMGTVGMVPEFMTFDDGKNFLAGGFGRKVHDSLYPECEYKRKWNMVDNEVLKRLYDKLILDAGVKVLFYNRVIDAVMEDKKVTYAIVSGPEGCYAISAKMFIDCTGSAAFCVMAGCETMFGDDEGITMPATLCSLWGNADFDKADLAEQPKYIEEAVKKGILSVDDRLLPGMKPVFPECQIAGGNIGHAFRVDDRNTESLTNAMFESRKIVAEYENYYKEYIKGFEDVKLVRTADVLGVRESRRAVCDFTLTKDYFFEKNAFYDEIGRYSYPIDMHPLKEGADDFEKFEKRINAVHEKGESYSIPYRALVLRDADNILTAGRTVGTDHEMIASVRVIPGAYITGQAAGAAAAIAVEDNVTTHDVDVKKLQTILKEIGAYLRVGNPDYSTID